jgi:hypothetical protein
MRNSGKIYEFVDLSSGEIVKGIAYDKDQTDTTAKLKKTIISPVDKDFKPIETPKIMRNTDKLKLIGFVD